MNLTLNHLKLAALGRNLFLGLSAALLHLHGEFFLQFTVAQQLDSRCDFIDQSRCTQQTYGNNAPVVKAIKILNIYNSIFFPEYVSEPSFRYAPL